MAIRSSSCWVQVSGSSEDFSRVQLKSDRCDLQARSSDVSAVSWPWSMFLNHAAQIVRYCETRVLGALRFSQVKL